MKKEVENKAEKPVENKAEEAQTVKCVATQGFNSSMCGDVVQDQELVLKKEHAEFLESNGLVEIK